MQTMPAHPLPIDERLRRESDRICTLILHSDLEWIDVAIQIEQMREICLQEDPSREELFEQIYVRRFQRLWEQWRPRIP